MIRLYGFFFLVDLALLVIALIDCLSTDEFAVRNMPKVVWVFLILLFSPIGAIVWFVAGRPQSHPVGRATDAGLAALAHFGIVFGLLGFGFLVSLAIDAAIWLYSRRSPYAAFQARQSGLSSPLERVTHGRYRHR